MKEDTMANTTRGAQSSDARAESEYDAIVIGAGFGGLYALHHLVEYLQIQDLCSLLHFRLLVREWLVGGFHVVVVDSVFVN